jgi:Bacterial Ig-like domain (group 3)/FG-GAP-like repeat
VLGNGDGTFQNASLWESGSLPNAVAVADLNGDGTLDIVGTHGFGNGLNLPPGTVDVLLQLGQSSRSTTTALVSTKNPVQPRQRVDYIATVTTKSGAIPTGTVTFRDGNQTLGTSPLFGNQAQLNYIHYTQNDLGTHSITAVYSGDADNDPSISPVFTENVQWSSRMDLTTSGSPSLVGQPVTFTATPISHGGFVPNGEIVTFFDFKTVLGTVPTSGGQAKFTTSSLSAKRHTIRATYPGDAIRQPSGASLPQVVNKYSTTSSLTSSPNPSAHGQTVTFTVTVTPSGPFTPTGKVKFLDGTTGLGYATLSGAVATFSKSQLAVGTHSITAQYLGDATSDKSTSSAVNQVVNP